MTQSIKFSQQIKNALANKKKLNKNVINFNHAANPSQVELSALMENYQSGRYETAESLAKGIIKKYPNNHFGWKVLGAIFNQTERLQEALIADQKVIAMAPLDPEAHNNLGNTLKALERPEEAEACYKKALEIKPDFAEAHYNLGIAQQALGKQEEAILSFQNAVSLNHNLPDAYSNLGLLLMHKGELVSAGDMHRRAIALGNKIWTTSYSYAAYLYVIGEIDSAAVSIKYAQSIAPNNNVKVCELALKAITSNKRANGNKLELTRAPSTNPSTRVDHLVLYRPVEDGLVDQLYQMNSRLLSATVDARYGNGRCSVDFDLFKDASKGIKVVAQDLTRICREAVNSEIFIYDSFFNIYGAGSGSKPHCHILHHDKYFNLGLRKFSLVYYLDVGDQSGVNPGALRLCEPDVEILPCNGMIVLINATKYHYAVYDGKADRVMIGVNFYSI